MEKTICSNNLDALENLCEEFCIHAFALELVINAAYANKDGIGPLGKYLELLSDRVERLRQSNTYFRDLFDCINSEIDIDHPVTVPAPPALSEGAITA